MKIDDKKTLSNLLKIPSTEILLNEDLKNHTTFKLSNSFAKGIIVCNTNSSLLKTLKVLKNKNSYSKNSKTHLKGKENLILGCGSNVVFKDNFYDNYIIKLGKNFKKIILTKKYVEVGAGVNLFVLNKFLLNNSLCGLEWSFGIPGSVGGAVIMNAGAFNHSFLEFALEVKVLCDGKIFWEKNFSFSYRNSSFKENKNIVLAVRLKLEKGKKEDILENQKQYFERRLSSQPQEFSAGSVFKHVFIDGNILYPAKMIDNLGLKGVKIGDAEISTKHAGFIVNKKNATSTDVLALIDLIEKEVEKNYKVKLQREIEII